MLVVVADSHVIPGTRSEAQFREFLRWLEGTDHDVAFLGDIMELWIGLGRYESALQLWFVQWCRLQCARRRIYLVEGNHEYFVVRHHRDCFTDCAADALVIPEWGVLLEHGDDFAGIATSAHRRFRWWCKSRLAHFLLNWMPGAAASVRYLKRKLEHSARKRKYRFEQSRISARATAVLQSPALRGVLYGHFHHALVEGRHGGRLLAVLPAWKENGEIGLYDPEANAICIMPWRQAARACPAVPRGDASRPMAFGNPGEMASPSSKIKKQTGA